jgi:hypothetical protein
MRNVRLESNGSVNKTTYTKSVGMPQCQFLAVLAILHLNIIPPKYL